MRFRDLVRLTAFAGVFLLGCTAVEAARLAPPTNVAPTGVAADAIEITWSIAEPNLVGFWIERSKPGRKRGFKKIAELTDGAARSFVDRGLESETVYYYRLRALQEKRSRSGKLRKPKKSRKTKPVSGVTLPEEAPIPEPTATPGDPPPPPPPPPAGGPGSPWAMGLGAGQTDIGVGVAVDTGGNVVLTGRFMDRVDFGTGRITSRGGFDAFVARYAADGTPRWSRGFGGSEGDDGRAVTVDGAGNVFVTGYFRRSMDLGGGSLASAGNADVFLAKYAPDGSHLWSQRFGGGGADMGYAIGTDAAGNVVVGGTFNGSVSFGGAALVPSFHAPTDLFVATYTPDGQHLWSRNYTSGGKAVVNGLAVAADGSIAVTGLFSGTLDFGGNHMTSASFTEDGFVAKLAPDGTHRWSRAFGSTNVDTGSSVAMDANGNVFVTGSFRHNVDFGGGPLADSGLGNIFVAKYAASNGLHRWSHAGGSFLETDAGTGIAVDADGNATVTGWFKGVASFGGTTLTSAGLTDAFLARYSSHGALRSVEALGGSGDDLGNGVAVSSDGYVATTGTFSGTCTFEGTTLGAAGGLDAYLVQLAP